MRTFRRAFLVPVLATVALLVGAPVAPAQEQEEFVTFEQAELITPFAVQVSGTLTCPPEAGSSFVSVELLQRGGPDGRRGFGSTSVPCTGNPEPFVVDVVGGPFRPGRATLVGTASYCVFRPPDDFRCFEDRDIREIPIQR